MAITKIGCCKISKNGKHTHLKNVINYITNPEKTNQGLYVTAFNCTKNPFFEMVATQEYFGKDYGRDAYHFIISFPRNEEIENQEAFNIVNEFAEKFLSERYEVLTALHTDKAHVHGHIVFNATSFVDGKKFRYELGDWENSIQPLVDSICDKYGINTLGILDEDGKYLYKKETKKNTNFSIEIKEKIDEFISTSTSFEEIIEKLRAAGIKIKYGKHIAIKLPGMQRYKRIKSLGMGYSESEIRERLFIKNNKIPINKFAAPEISKNKLTNVNTKHYKKYKQMTVTEKIHFRRMLNLGVLNKKTSSWMHKKEIEESKLLQIEFDLIRKYNISGVSSMERALNSLDEEIKNVEREMKTFKKEKAPYVPIINLLYEIQNINEEATLFETGKAEFIEAYEKRKELIVKLKGFGFSVEEAEKLNEKIKNKQKFLKESKKKIILKQKCINRMKSRDELKNKIKTHQKERQK